MAPCPICSRPAPARAQNGAWPFCSPRCRQLDLGKWLDEGYRIPVDDDAPGDDPSRLAQAEENA